MKWGLTAERKLSSHQRMFMKYLIIGRNITKNLLLNDERIQRKPGRANFSFHRITNFGPKLKM